MMRAGQYGGKARKPKNDAAIYGVFGESSEDDNGDYDDEGNAVDEMGDDRGSEDDEDFGCIGLGNKRKLHGQGQGQGYDTSFDDKEGRRKGETGKGRGKGRGQSGARGRGQSALPSSVAFVSASAFSSEGDGTTDSSSAGIGDETQSKFRQLMEQGQGTGPERDTGTGMGGGGTGLGGRGSGGMGIGIGIGLQDVLSTSTSTYASTISNSTTCGPPQIVPKDTIPTDMGSWQKHTKGIGLKYLQKFGFSGRLGKEESGIARPIETVVHSGMQGLGFGKSGVNNKDKEKDKQKINADLRADTLVISMESDKDINYIGERRLPPVTAVWKKTVGSATRAGGTSFKTVESLINQLRDRQDGDGERVIGFKSNHIIDMTGHSTTTTITHTNVNVNAKPLLGQELLYNISHAYHALEEQVHQDGRRLTSAQTRLHNATIEYNDITRQHDDAAQRYHRLDKLSQALSKIEAKMLTDPSAVSIPVAISSIISLYHAFPQEVTLFGLIRLVSTLTDATVHTLTENWDPLSNPQLLQDLKNEWDPLVNTLDRNSDAALASESRHSLQVMFNRYCLPCINRVLSSESCWNPVQGGSAQAAVELVLEVRVTVSTHVADDLLEKIILPRLVAAVDEWVPVHSLKQNGSTAVSEATAVVPLHEWLQPWLPLVGSRLSEIYPTIRRKISKALEAAGTGSGAKVGAQVVHTNAVVETISTLSLHDARKMIVPWLDIFDRTALDRMLVRAVVPRLITEIRNTVFIVPHYTGTHEHANENEDITDADTRSLASTEALKALSAVVAWNNIIPSTHISAILLGEAMPRWLYGLATWLQEAHSISIHRNTNQQQPVKVSVITSAHLRVCTQVKDWYNMTRNALSETLLKSNPQLRAAMKIALDMIAFWDDNISAYAASLSSATSGTSTSDTYTCKQSGEKEEALLEPMELFHSLTSGTLFDLRQISTSTSRSGSGFMSSLSYMSYMEWTLVTFAASANTSISAREGAESKINSTGTGIGGAFASRSLPSISFRDVVESLAEEQGWSMRPRDGMFYEGHQLFTLGPHGNAYIHKGVLFVQRNGSTSNTGCGGFYPTSLEALKI